MPRAPKDDKPKKLALVPKSAPAKAAKPKKKAAPKKRAPKPASQVAALDGPRPLSQFDLQFCHIYVQTGKYVEGIRQQNPDSKDPYKEAHRMMSRPEIREHIKSIYVEIDRQRKQAAAISARANLLSLEVADDRLMEIMQQPRKTRAEMLTRDIKTMLVRAPGSAPQPPIEPLHQGATEEEREAYDEMVSLENDLHRQAQNDALMAHLEQPAPVEDGDLLKAIDLVYKRKGGIIKADKEVVPTHTTVMLYKPKWFGTGRTLPGAPPTIEVTNG